MPTYEYACTDCGARSEVVQRFTDDPLTACSTCGGKLRKLFSAVGIVFKGSGFYRNDSRKESESKITANAGGSNGSANGGSASSSAAGESGKSDSGTSSGDKKSESSSGSSSSGSDSSSGSSQSSSTPGSSSSSTGSATAVPAGAKSARASGSKVA